ncbi:MAG: ABC transporter substrate-binding protein, partial [Campylobacteraceae bacterium]|nr:ABC transporter substrate-binding protein [Campylobacteraceae bacterium]
MFILRSYIILIMFSNIAFPQYLEHHLKEITVQLNWKHQFEHAGFYAAIKKGYYQQIGLKINLREKQSGSSSFDEVMSGKAEFGIGYSGLVLEYVNGEPVVALASLFQHSPLVFLSKQTSNIRNVSDFVGKKVMVSPTSKSSASLNIMMKKEGISYDDVFLQQHSYDINDLINDKTDVVAVYVSNQPFYLKEKNIAYNIIDPANFGFDFYENILFTNQNMLKNNSQMVKDFVSATLKGWKYALENEDEIIDLILEQYSKKKSRQALKYEANIIKTSLMPQNIPIGEIDKRRFERIITLYEELGIITQSNSNLEKFIYRDKNEINLSLKEIEWIKKNKTIYFTGNPNWLPYEAFEDGKYVGIVNEHLQLIEQYTGLQFLKLETSSWSESLDFALNKNVDMLSETTSSVAKNQLSFTKSYLSSPIVMVMNKKASYRNSLEDIKDKKIAVIKDYGYISEIKKDHPNLNYHEVNNLQEGLLEIENGQADVFLSALPQGSFWINKMGLQNLRIVGKTKYEASLAFAIRSDYPVLVGILNKAIDSIPKNKQQEILEHWNKTKYIEKTDYRMLWVLFAISAMIITFLVFRHRTLTKYNKELTYLSQTDNLTKIYNRIKINQVLDEQMNLFKRYKETFGVILIDIDYFKKVNDAFGHDIGDIVLIEFVNHLKNNIRDVDYLGRWGGE